MKKTTLTLVLATALFTSITLLNCSKKEDPAPATTTTSGTTTSGTTTSGTTTSGTTTSGTTTSGTTTSGSTTSGTTTSGTTTSGIRYGGSGTFTLDGANQTATTVWTLAGSSDSKINTVNAQNEKYSFQIRIRTETLQDGTYAIGKGPFAHFGGDAGIVVVPIGVVGVQYWSDAGGSVVVSGKKISISSVNLTNINDETKKMTASCNISLQ